MKKKLLFIPLLGLALSGCSLNVSFFWGNNEEESQEEQPESDEKNLENPGKTDDEGKQEETGVPVTKTINFYGSYLPSEWTAPGVSMDSTLLSSGTQNERLINATKAQVNDTTLLSELFFTKLNTGYYESSGLVLQIGTGSGSGSFVWTSTKKITKVEVTGQCYTKPQGSTDSSAHITIEAGEKGTDVTQNNNYQRPIIDGVTADMSFEVESGEALAYKTFTNEYENGINRFCLKSSGGRMFLKSLTITWNS